MAKISTTPKIIPACISSVDVLSSAAQKVVKCVTEAKRALNGWQAAEQRKLDATQEYFQLLAFLDKDAAQEALKKLLNL